MSLSVRKYIDDEEKTYWCVERRSKVHGHIIHEVIAQFNNGKEAEKMRKDLKAKDSDKV